MRNGRRGLAAGLVTLLAVAVGGGIAGAAAPVPTTTTFEVQESQQDAATYYRGYPAQQETSVWVTVAADAGTPGGTVSVTTDGQAQAGCTGVPLSGGRALCTIRWAHPRTSVVRAVYSGAADFTGSSAETTLTVDRALTYAYYTGPTLTYPQVLKLEDIATQLATAVGTGAPVPGHFESAPALPAVLPAGFQYVYVTFVPDDLTEYRPFTDYTVAWVQRGTQTLTSLPVGPVTAADNSVGLPLRSSPWFGLESYESSTPGVCEPSGSLSSSGDGALFGPRLLVHGPGTCRVSVTLGADQNYDTLEQEVTFPVLPAAASRPAPRLETRLTSTLPTSGPLVSPVLSTGGPGRLMVAFVSLGSGPDTESRVAGGGLLWTLAARSTTGGGTSEVWQAWAAAPLNRVRITAGPVSGPRGRSGSLTVAAFTGATAGVGKVAEATGTGTAHTSLTPNGRNSLVWAVGHLTGPAVAVTTGIDQRVSTQYANPAAAQTHWTQYVFAPTSVGRPVDVGVVRPTSGVWELTAVEIPAAP